jgi:L-cysteate sulfo-lyase
VKLANLPTPLEYLDNLTQKLGGPQILIKRDDLTGLATGGNKTRKLEYLLGDALNQNADMVVTCANPQSNHIRQTAAAARKLGLDVVLVISDQEPTEINGNLLLDKILGADLHFVGGTEDDLEPKMEKIAQELREEGHRPYVIKRFGSVPIGTIGYVDAFVELVNQVNQRKITIDHIIVAGGGGTYSGLCLGAKAMSSDLNVTGIAISKRTLNWKKRISELGNQTAAYLGLDLSFKPQEVNVLVDYIGEGYGIPTEGMVEAIKLVAQTEGILLDPIYTGKAMDGLIDLVQRGIFTKQNNVLFWHTGGVPNLFTPQYRKLFI